MPSTITPTPTTALTPAALLGMARDLAAERDAWRSLVQHHAHERWCLRVDAHDDHDVWLIGWDSFQGVDLHDHGGSAGALYVIEGELLEVSTLPRAPGRLHEQSVPAGTARAFGPGYVHRVVNRSATVATSIHVYSPPLVSMDFYAVDAGRALTRTHRESAFGARSGRGELR